MHIARSVGCTTSEAFWAAVFAGVIFAIQHRSVFKKLLKVNPYVSLFVSCAVISGIMAIYVEIMGSQYLLNYMTQHYLYVQNASAFHQMYEKFWFDLYRQIGFDPFSEFWSNIILYSTEVSWYALAISMLELAFRFGNRQTRLDWFKNS